MADRIGVMLIHSCGCLGYYMIAKSKNAEESRKLYSDLRSVPCEKCEEKGGEKNGK